MSVTPIPRPPSPSSRLAFWIGAVAVLAACSAPVKRCEFPLWVSVMPDEEADAECRRLGVRSHDNGDFVKDSTTLRGCAPKDRIITNGEEWVGGH